MNLLLLHLYPHETVSLRRQVWNDITTSTWNDLTTIFFFLVWLIGSKFVVNVIYDVPSSFFYMWGHPSSTKRCFVRKTWKYSLVQRCGKPGWVTGHCHVTERVQHWIIYLDHFTTPLWNIYFTIKFFSTLIAYVSYLNFYLKSTFNHFQAFIIQ